jgi:hypothetical protein
MNNSDKKYFIISILIGLFGLTLFLAPILLPIDMMDWGGAMIFIGIFLAITGPIISLLFWYRMRVFDELMDENNLIAHWHFEQPLWEMFVKDEIGFRAGEHRGLQLLTLFITVVTGSIFWIADPEEGWIVALVLMLVNVIIAVVVWLVSHSITKWHLDKMVECRIGANGLILNNQFHVWKGWGARLENVRESHNKLHLIEITYSAPSRYSRQYYTIRIPVPGNEEKNIKQVMDKISALI